MKYLRSRRGGSPHLASPSPTSQASVDHRSPKPSTDKTDSRYDVVSLDAVSTPNPTSANPVKQKPFRRPVTQESELPQLSTKSSRKSLATAPGMSNPVGASKSIRRTNTPVQPNHSRRQPPPPKDAPFTVSGLVPSFYDTPINSPPSTVAPPVLGPKISRRWSKLRKIGCRIRKIFRRQQRHPRNRCRSHEAPPSPDESEAAQPTNDHALPRRSSLNTASLTSIITSLNFSAEPSASRMDAQPDVDDIVRAIADDEEECKIDPYIKALMCSSHQRPHRSRGHAKHLCSHASHSRCSASRSSRRRPIFGATLSPRRRRHRC